MFRLFILSSLSVLTVCFSTTPTHAAEAQPGDACTTNGAVQNTGGPEQMPRRTLICNGTTWQNALEQTTAGASLFQVGNDTGSCTAAKLGRIRYNGSATWEFCNGSSWINMVGGTALSGITSATATNTINNTTYTQSWGWNGITTQNGLEMGSNSLTSGSLLGVAVTNSAATGNAIGAVTTATGDGATAIRAISMGTSGVTAAIYGESASTGGAGLSGQSTATSGINYGGYFLNASSGGYGVYAANTGTSGSTYGIRGAVTSTTGIGVSGAALATTGLNYGVHGTTASTGGRAVFGNATATSGVTYAVYGVNSSSDGRGVVGHVTAASGATFGLSGVSDSTSGRGVSGTATASTGSTYGGFFSSDSNDGTGVYAYSTASSGSTFGLYGRAQSGAGYGIYCFSATNANGCGGNRAWYNASDERLKKDVVPLQDAEGLEAIMQLNPVHYKWRDAQASDQSEMGFIAQEVEQVLPELVGTGPDTDITTADGSSETIENPKSMSYAGVVVPLVKAVQQLKTENDALRSQNADLLRRVEALETAGKN